MINCIRGFRWVTFVILNTFSAEMIPSPRQILIVAGRALSLTTSVRSRTLTTQKMPTAGETEDCPVTKAPRMADVEKPVVLKFSKLTDVAFTPTKGSKQAAGYDLYRLAGWTLDAWHWSTGRASDLVALLSDSIFIFICSM